MKRALTPATNAPGLGSAIAAIYAAAVMIVNAANHHGVINAQVVVAALGAAAFLYARFKVTPVADPKDGNGQPLVALPPGASIIAIPAASAPAKTLLSRGGYSAGDTAVSDLPPPPPSMTEPPPSVSDLLAPPVVPPAAPE